MRVRSKTWLNILILAIAQVMIRFFYLWVDLHIGGAPIGMITTFMQFIGFAISVVVLAILCRVNVGFILALLAQLVEIVTVIASYAANLLIEEEQSLVNGANNALVILNCAEFFGVLVTMFILIGVGVASKKLPLKIIGFLLAPIILLVGTLYFGFWTQISETQYKLTEAIVAVDPENTWEDSFDKINYLSLAEKYISGKYGELGEEVFDTVFPDVKDLFAQMVEAIIDTVIFRLVLSVTRVIVFIYEIVAALILIKFCKNVRIEEKAKKAAKKAARLDKTQAVATPEGAVIEAAAQQKEIAQPAADQQVYAQQNNQQYDQQAYAQQNNQQYVQQAYAQQYNQQYDQQ